MTTKKRVQKTAARHGRATPVAVNPASDMRTQVSNLLTRLLSDFGDYCRDMRERYDEELREWNSRARAHKSDHAKPHFGPKPRPFSVLKNCREAERLMQLHLLLEERMAKSREPEPCLHDERLDALLKSDVEARRTLADIWRRAYAMPDHKKGDQDADHEKPE